MNPESRQGAALKAAVEDQIVRCGPNYLLGVFAVPHAVLLAVASSMCDIGIELRMDSLHASHPQSRLTNLPVAGSGKGWWAWALRAVW